MPSNNGHILVQMCIMFSFIMTMDAKVAGMSPMVSASTAHGLHQHECYLPCTHVDHLTHCGAH